VARSSTGVARGSDETVIITTDDLEPAVRLRAAFEEIGYATELLTAGEEVETVRGEPVLLIVTGHLREPRARARIASARAVRLPALGLLEPTEPSSREICRLLGLTECLVKPVDVDEAVQVGRRLIQREQLRRITGIVGETDVMEEVLERVVQIASVDSTALIQGESGTGKELVARGIHALSARRHRPFIAVNVAALPETLLESELFGHEKGAFTGAASLRKGLFELAHSGDIFLDEIGEMPMGTQTKLLRVLEEREFRRVGGEELIRVDVRVIAATNRSLREEVEAGRFRRDLYHRLNVLRIELPSLRERKEDIPPLVERFIDEFSRAHDRPFRGIDPEAMQILVDYRWPGNVRELRNLVESMVVLAPGRVIGPLDIPAEVRSGGRTLLPVSLRPAPQARAEADGGELEFVLRTLFDLKLDLDDLRREFEVYRRRRSSEVEIPFYPALPPAPSPPPALEREAEPVQLAVPDEDRVVYRPGMTMQDVERETIAAALREVNGNRRRAAEILQIGERTLYRKIKEYEIAEG
jgi:DNA-binding NtrC family response regulator